MPAKCPNCLDLLRREATGDYPSRCPKCGVRLKAKSSSAQTKVTKTAPVASAANVNQGGERVIRSFSTSRKHDPSTAFEKKEPVEQANQQSANPVAESSPFEAPIDSTLPIDQPALTEDPIFASGNAEPNPFQPATEVSPFSPVGKPDETPAAAEVVNPFGATSVPVVPRTSSRANLIRWIIIGVLIAGSVGGIGTWMYLEKSRNAKAVERSGFHNPDRGYILYSMEAPWKPDAGRAIRAGFDLALYRDDLKSWITIRTMKAKDPIPTLREATEQAGVLWKDRIPDFAVGDTLTKTKLSDVEAMVVTGEGTLDGVARRGKTICAIVDDVIYHLSLEAPVEGFDIAEVEFAKARKNFELTGAISDGSKEIGSEAMSVFASKTYPYRLTAPSKIWREVPDRQTDSRFDDLKLLDRTRTAEITVAPWRTDDLPGMRVRYVDTQKRRYENKVREIESSIEKMEINGRKAMRTVLIVNTLGGDMIMHASFILGDGLVFVIQGRAPLEKREEFEPAFARIVDTFEVLDKAPEPPAPKEEKAPATKAEPDQPKAAADKKGNEKAEEKAEKKMDSEPKEEKKTEAKEKSKPASEPKKTDEKKPEETPKKKRKSLDDLD